MGENVFKWRKMGLPRVRDEKRIQGEKNSLVIIFLVVSSTKPNELNGFYFFRNGS